MENLEKISKVFGLVLPVLGVIALIILIVLLVKILKIVSGLNTTVGAANESLDLVKGYLGEFNTTVRAVNNMSMSVESVRVTLTSLITKAIKKWAQEYETIRNMLTSILESLTKKGNEVTIVEQKKEEV
ncbi:MAG: hypothetical protein IKX74_01385 [Erysipelotrichaceae bacterium]|nr:hypothetical protein [Erysipelotrichaceae bacterium]MBR5048291.1 hypothetical protein [Erysipelotrichaceae bacterium]